MYGIATSIIIIRHSNPHAAARGPAPGDTAGDDDDTAPEAVASKASNTE